jgi:hypothetical protein
MPFASKSQMRKCYAAADPKWDCREWSRATPDPKSLPQRKKPKCKEARAMSNGLLSRLGSFAAEKPLVEKFAADSGLAPDAIAALADAVQVTPAQFVKWAYADPKAFGDLVRRVEGLDKRANEPLTSVGTNLARGRGVFGGAGSPLPEKKGSATGLSSALLAATRKAAEKKAAAHNRQTAMLIFNHYLDKVAARLPAEKQASVRTLQAQLALGRPINRAIKVAFPTAIPEQRGVLAAKLTKAAADEFNAFVAKRKQGPKSATGKPDSKEVKGLMKEAAPGGVDGGTRVMNALRSLVSGRGATSARGGRAFGAANEGKLKERAATALPQHRGLAVEEYTGGRRAARQQAIGDRDVARIGAAGVGGLGLGTGGMAALGGGGSKPPAVPAPAPAPVPPPAAVQGRGRGIRG